MRNFSPAPMFLLLFLFGGCVRGPVQEKKSAADYLNGEHYEKSGEVLSVPVLSRKIKNTTVSGRVVVEDPLAVLPTGLTVQIWQGGKLFAEAPVERTGGFSLTGELANGSYLLRVDSSRFSGEQSLLVDTWKIEGVQLRAARKKPTQ